MLFFFFLNVNIIHWKLHSLQLFKLKGKVFPGCNSWIENSSGTYTTKSIAQFEIPGLVIFILNLQPHCWYPYPFIRSSVLLEHRSARPQHHPLHRLHCLNRTESTACVLFTFASFYISQRLQTVDIKIFLLK